LIDITRKPHETRLGFIAVKMTI